MGRGGVGRLEGFVGRLILCFRPRFDRARTGDFLAEQKIRGFGSVKVLGVGDCWGCLYTGVKRLRATSGVTCSKTTFRAMPT
jgi:hypothetical protein